MPYTTIPAHTDGATVEVFEPSQHPSQKERVIDRFELLPGEARGAYELRSATAGIRYLPLGEETKRRFYEGKLKVEPVGAGGIKNPDGILPVEEMQAGRARQQELEAMEKKRDQGRKRGQAALDKKAQAEANTGAAAQRQAAEGVGERGEARRGSNEPHPGTPNELGQTPLSPAAHVTNPGPGPVDAGFVSPAPQASTRDAPRKSTPKKGGPKRAKAKK